MNLADRAGKRIYNRDINNSFLEFDECLYNSESDCHSEALTHNFFSSINLEEVTEAIYDLQNNKTPGPDGLNAECYEGFQGLLIDLLLKMLSYSFESGALPDTMMDTNISLILKKGKPADD